MSGRFSVRFAVRFRDVDVFGHVNNSVYFTYMETARTEYWMHLFEVSDIRSLQFIVAHAECDFIVAARHGDEIETTIWTSSVGNSSFVWEYEMKKLQNGELLAKGKTIQVYYDYSTEKSIRVPEEVRKRLLSA